MKKKLLIVALVAGLLPTLFSCTENQRARQFGGTITIELPPGEKLVMATWKETDLFYLTEPMDSNNLIKFLFYEQQILSVHFESALHAEEHGGSN